MALVSVIMNIFTLLEKELNGGGKQKSTEPYHHFEDGMNEIYDYVKEVFETNETKKMFVNVFHMMMKMICFLVGNRNRFEHTAKTTNTSVCFFFARQ